MSAPGGSAPGVSAPGGGGLGLLLGAGVVCSRGGGGASKHALRQTPSPLLTESHTPVKTSPWPNFVAAGNKDLTPCYVT